jgi:single-stranded-DNA-specific exonuclease
MDEADAPPYAALEGHMGIEAGARAFLDVERSLGGRRWRARLDAAGEARAQAIAQTTGQTDLLSRILAGRGVALEHVERHLEPTLRDLMPDPLTMADMGNATERLAYAVAARERVAIFGDYDVDGACSAALLSETLSELGCETLIRIPDRVTEGYGPSVAVMRELHAGGAKLVVTVDCGAVSFEPFVEARRLGLDVIVFDHHQAPEILPPALALVDPNRQDDLSGLGALCAAGVVFMALVDLNRRLRGSGRAPDLKRKLDLVALATVADVAPLTGLNRAFVARGLEVMRRRERRGLAALFDVAGANGPPTPYHLGFLIGPRINAGGRIGDAALGARLLTSTDADEVERLAAELDRLNRERQRIELAVVAEAEAQALAAMGLEERGPCVIVAGEGWPPGVVGLVASRLKDRFGRPAFALALNGAHATGSARSIPGVDIGRIVAALTASGHIVKGGGHAMAAGLTVLREKLGDLRAHLEAALERPVADARRNDDGLVIDAALAAAGATPDLWRAVEQAGPFGSGNPEPVFALPRHRIEGVTQVGADHLRFRAVAGDGRALDGIAFRVAGKPLGQGLRTLQGSYAHLAGSLTLDNYGGRERVRFRLIDAAPAPN